MLGAHALHEANLHVIDMLLSGCACSGACSTSILGTQQLVRMVDFKLRLGLHNPARPCALVLLALFALPHSQPLLPDQSR